MAILEIKKYPDQVLKKKAKEVKEITPETEKLIDDMVETFKKNQGLGLAANQVGELKRIVVIGTEKGTEIFLNPKVIQKSREKDLTEEGCLSFPGLFLKIKRAKEIKIQAQNKKGEEIKTEAKGLMARVFQHEIDHLDGILFIDRLNFWQKLKIKYKFKFLKYKIKNKR